MNKYEKSEIEIVEKYIAEELKRVEQIGGREEMISRGMVLDRLFKVLSNYDELVPVLNKFFEEKHYKEKWGMERDARDREG